MKISELKKIDPSIEVLKGIIDDFDIKGISNSDNPKKHTIVFLKNKKYLNLLGHRSKENFFGESILLVQKSYQDSMGEDDRFKIDKLFSYIGTVQSVDQAMCLLSKPFYDLKFSLLNLQVDGRQLGSSDIHPDAEISQGVFIGENVKIGAGTIIMPGCNILPQVEIGENCLIFPNVTIYPYSQIGDNCRIHAGTVIGADGFGYNFFNGKHQKIWHYSGVVIGNDVEIGCNAMLDAGAFTPTQIGSGTKIDNDVQISHNVKVGEHVIICGKSGLAGSVEVQDYCAFGAGAGVAPSAVIEKGAQVAARAVVSENAVVPAGSVYAGHPARPLKEWLHGHAVLRKLAKK